MEKLVFKRKESKALKNLCVVMKVRVSTKELIEEIEEETGLSKQEVLEKMIRFAYNNIEWEE